MHDPGKSFQNGCSTLGSVYRVGAVDCVLWIDSAIAYYYSLHVLLSQKQRWVHLFPSDPTKYDMKALFSVYLLLIRCNVVGYFLCVFIGKLTLFLPPDF